jgi:hypothetical protein
MALESSTVPVPSKGKALAVGEEFKNALLSLRAKYEKTKDQLEVVEVAHAEQVNEMHVG